MASRNSTSRMTLTCSNSGISNVGPPGSSVGMSSAPISRKTQFRESPLAEWQRGLPALAFTAADSENLFCLEWYLAAIRLVVVDEEGLRRPNWTNSEEWAACRELAAQALVAAAAVSDTVGVWIHLEDDPDVDHDQKAIAAAKALADDAEDAFALFVRVVDLRDGRRVIAFGPDAVPDLILAGRP